MSNLKLKDNLVIIECSGCRQLYAHEWLPTSVMPRRCILCQEQCEQKLVGQLTPPKGEVQ
ncbi:MAG TPA: hypothetical protein VFS96_06230 [Nitrolancea sp.]|nr:hypothetical protein [Nitrolancea sp.]